MVDASDINKSTVENTAANRARSANACLNIFNEEDEISGNNNVNPVNIIIDI